MPQMNSAQVTYYLDKRIWREAHRISEKRGDAPPIVYYWWLGGDLGQARQAQLELLGVAATADFIETRL